MMKLWSHFVCVALACLLVSSAVAQDAASGGGKGKGRPVNHPLLKATSALELTEAQKPKVEALGKEFTETMLALRAKGLTQELTKKKNEAMKKAREAGKKGQELQTEAFASLDATEAEKALLKQAAEAQAKLQKGMAAILTKEQIATLPQQVKQGLNQAKPRAAGAARAKKDAA
jgi:hypothetical protein